MGKSNKKPHALSTDPNIGKFWRDAKYRKNGFSYISKAAHIKDRQQPYNAMATIKRGLSHGKIGTSPQLPAVAAYGDAHAARYMWGFTNPMNRMTNFDVGKSPYRNEAHHLIPVSTFPEYTPEQQDLLKKIPYDINHGENIIFLPNVASRCKIHNLPQHSGDHPKYTTMVKKDTANTRKSLNKALKKKVPCEEWEPPKNITEKLIKIQKDYWELLVTTGPVNINTVKPKLKLRKKGKGK